MKKTFTILFLLCTASIFSQTKKITEEWIEAKYNEFERVNSLSNTMDLYFEDNYLYYEYLNAFFKVKIKDIKEIEFKKERFSNKDKEGWISLCIRMDDGKLFYKEANDTGFTKSTETAFKIPFSAEIKEDDYHKRMEKAIVHLVKLNGGNAKVKREPF
ncbi:MAG: hypothetical protein CL526_09435 [Aequorivita sp.]|nr:hypothetical protein [Aequorivita sp.]|tara:strand:+ start:9792 stop:10265 length:474 start_codon:yes stop_codon:yes gene_type:complete